MIVTFFPSNFSVLTCTYEIDLINFHMKAHTICQHAYAI